MPAGPAEPLHDRLEDRAPPYDAIGISLHGQAKINLFFSGVPGEGGAAPCATASREMGRPMRRRKAAASPRLATWAVGAELQLGSGESGSGAILSGPGAGDCVSGGAVRDAVDGRRYFRGDDDGAF